MKQRYIAKIDFLDYCFVGILESANAVESLLNAIIAHLNEVRGFMEEISPELEVVDSISGNIVS